MEGIAVTRPPPPICAPRPNGEWHEGMPDRRIGERRGAVTRDYRDQWAAWLAQCREMHHDLAETVAQRVREQVGAQIAEMARSVERLDARQRQMEQAMAIALGLRLDDLTTAAEVRRQQEPLVDALRLQRIVLRWSAVAAACAVAVLIWEHRDVVARVLATLGMPRIGE